VERRTSRFAAKAHDQALFIGGGAEARILHGKEGVDGSSPSERALQKSRKSELFLLKPTCTSSGCGGYGAAYGACRFRKGFRARHEVTCGPAVQTGSMLN